MGEIRIRLVDPAAERARILGVLAASLPKAAPPARFDWLYLSNPDGRALVWLAEHDDGTILGTSAAHPRRMRVGGDVVRALNLGDFAIDRSQRALGPALRLLRATLGPVHDGTYAFSYDFSNAAMHAVYRRMHVNSLGHDERWMQPVSMTRLARDKLSNRTLAAVVGAVGDVLLHGRGALHRRARGLDVARLAGECGDEFDALDVRLPVGRAVVGVRDAAYLNWRYLRNPVWSHDIVCARAGGRLAGYAVVRRTAPGTAALVDLQTESTDVARALLAGAIECAAAQDAGALHVEVLAEGPAAQMVRMLGFIRRESQAGPVVCRPSDSPHAGTLDAATNWWLIGGDRDV